MEDVKPGTWMILGGGVLLVISPLLDWASAGSFSVSGLETDAFGFQGIFVLLIGLALAGLGAVLAFGSGSVDLPEQIGPLSLEGLALALALSAFLITFGLQFNDGAAIGLTLGWLAAGVAGAGAVLNSQGVGGGPSAPSGPPQQF